jgi:tRNA A37 threonylcarbamoyladenosine biosynthesis protein TsaE
MSAVIRLSPGCKSPTRQSQRYGDGAQNPHPYKVYHVDLYRVENFTDLESLGLEDVLGERAVVIVEWPDRFTFRTDWPRIDIRLEHVGGDSRRIAISGLRL